jgi:hypothetical protein
MPSHFRRLKRIPSKAGERNKHMETSVDEWNDPPCPTGILAEISIAGPEEAFLNHDPPEHEREGDDTDCPGEGRWVSEDSREEDQHGTGIHWMTDETIRSTLKQWPVCRCRSEVELLAGEAEACRDDEQKTRELHRNDKRVEEEEITLNSKGEEEQHDNRESVPSKKGRHTSSSTVFHEELRRAVKSESFAA